MKTCDQRRRKRRRDENEDLEIQTTLQRLELDGKPVGDNAWIRLVTPYAYTFATFAKARWVGRTILDVYHSEFGGYPKAYYASAISQGRIKVSDSVVGVDYEIRGGDLLTHTVHRHEPAVAVSTGTVGSEVEIIADLEELLVVNKPGTMPVHPCGAYHANSLIRILEPGFGVLYNINRLDRLTSGLVVLGKTPSAARLWGRFLKERDKCEKIYLARVKGKFPLKYNADLNVTARLHQGERCPFGQWTRPGKFSGPGKSALPFDTSMMRKMNTLGFWFADARGAVQDAVSPVAWFDRSQRSIDDWVRALEESTDSPPCDFQENKLQDVCLWFYLACPTRVAEPKNGICEAGLFDDIDDRVYGKTVKPSLTSFGIVRYDEDTDSTIVVCRPVTGRTHQIRLHLQYLGHPIANDPNYGGDISFNDWEGKACCRRARMLLDVMDNSKARLVGEFAIDKNAVGNLGETSTEMLTTTDETTTFSQLDKRTNESLQSFIQRTCMWCVGTSAGEESRTMLEFLVRSRGIWLHALQYTVTNEDGIRESYRTRPPTWSVTQ